MGASLLALAKSIYYVNWQLVKIDNEQITKCEKFTLLPKTRSTLLQNWNKKKRYNKKRLKL